MTQEANYDNTEGQITKESGTDSEQRMNELEQAAAEKETEISRLRESNAELEEKLLAADKSLTEAVSSYRALALRAHPEIPQELVNGDGVEAINTSLAKALELTGRIRKSVEADISLARVPAGAPERTSQDLSGLSPREKIQHAIGKR